MSPTHRSSKKMKMDPPRYSDRHSRSHIHTHTRSSAHSSTHSFTTLILLSCLVHLLESSYLLFPFLSSIVVSSQPVSGEDFTDGCEAAGGVLVESFTQPSRFDELIIGTQIPCTPGASQVLSYSFTSQLFIVLLYF